MKKSDVQKLWAWAELTAEMFDITPEQALRDAAGDKRNSPWAAKSNQPQRNTDLEEALLHGDKSQAVTNLLLRAVLEDHKPGEIVTAETVCHALGLSDDVLMNVGRRIGRNPEIAIHLQAVGDRINGCKVYRRKHLEVRGNA